jgi:hypothetical protein
MLHYPSPTKEYMLRYREKEGVKKLFHLAFEKRPVEELFDLRVDPNQLNNVAKKADYQAIKKMLSQKLDAYLTKTADPRVIGGEMKWLGAKYFSERDKRPSPSKHSQEVFSLKPSYSYLTDTAKQNK